jgi:archaellum component FlaC
MVIDYTITAGNIIEIGSIIIGGLYALATIKSNVGMLKTEVSEMQSEIKKISEVLINQADQNRRIIHLEEDVRELRHGRGFVQGPRGVDREYGSA